MFWVPVENREQLVPSLLSVGMSYASSITLIVMEIKVLWYYMQSFKMYLHFVKVWSSIWSNAQIYVVFWYWSHSFVLHSCIHSLSLCFYHHPLNGQCIVLMLSVQGYAALLSSGLDYYWWCWLIHREGELSPQCSYSRVPIINMDIHILACK